MTDVVLELDCRSVEERDLVSLYVMNKLSEADAEAFEKHYFGCERCWDEVQRATEVRAALAGSGAPSKAKHQTNAKLLHGPWPRLRPILVAAAVLAAVAVGVVLVGRRSSPSSPLTELSAAVVSTRPTEGWLSGFRYAPAATVARGQSPRIPERVRRAAYRALGSAGNQDDAISHRTAGVANLLLGNPSEAIRELELAKTTSPTDPAVLNDLAAAYLERASYSGSRQDRESALRNINRALQIKPVSPEALFNRALLIESLHGAEAAEKAWSAFLASDSKTPAADEARKHLDKLRHRSSSLSWSTERDAYEVSSGSIPVRQAVQLAETFPQELRMWVGDRALPRWGEAFLSNDLGGADRLLSLARYATAGLQHTNGDRLLADAVAVIDASTSAERLLLARAHRDYGLARALYPGQRIPEAIAAMERAEMELRAAASPFAMQATFYRAALLFQSSQSEAAGKLLEKLHSTDSYTSLWAMKSWMQGVLLSSHGRLEEAMHHYRAALLRFDQLKEAENLASARDLVASALVRLGQNEEAWKQRERAIEFLDRAPSVFRFHSILTSATSQAIFENRYATALLLQNRVVANARREGDAELLADSLRQRALILSKTGDSGANADFGKAQEVCARIADPGLRQRELVEIELSRAQADLVNDPVLTTTLLDSAIAFFESTGAKVRLPQCHLLRGRARRLINDNAAAMDDFEAGLSIFESERRVTSPELRLTVFGQAQEIFDEVVDLLLREGRPEEALLYAERSRSRTLIDRLLGLKDVESRRLAPKRLPGVAEIRARLPRGLIAVEYAILPGRVVAWTVTRDDCRVHTLAATPAEIEQLRRELTVAGEEGNDTAFRRLTAKLGGILLSDIPREGFDAAVFIPDKGLWATPFAALRRSEGDPYVLQLFTTVIAPSLTAFVEDRGNPTAVSTSILAVGVSAPAPELGLKPLLHAEDEARAVASSFPNAELLVGGDASRDRFLHSAANSSVIHFAGHAVNRPNPLTSVLRFGSVSDGSETNLLYLREIIDWRLSAARLVVLSACSTSTGEVIGREGLLSFSNAFLLAGASATIGSLWPIDDAQTADFFKYFYQRYRGGMSPAAALREAQVRVCCSPQIGARSANVWAALTLLGSRKALISQLN